jgi:hypothetical protein
MRIFFIGLIGLFGIIITAFSLKLQKPMNDKANKSTAYYWFVAITYTGRHNTHTEEIQITGCPDTGARHCEDGYLGDDFNTANDPTSGLKLGATIDDVIHMP